MSAFQLRAYDKCPNETAEYGYSLDTDSGTGVFYFILFDRHCFLILYSEYFLTIMLLCLLWHPKLLLEL